MFKTIATTLFLVALSAGTAQAWERIDTEAAYRAQVVGNRQVVAGSGHAVVQPDGTVTGEWNGQPVSGNWSWNDGYYCRSLRIGNTDTGSNCQLIEVEGNQIRSTNDRGQGRNVTATLE